jgi:regulator of sigma E protease
MGYAAAFIFALAVLVTFHELGHYLAARLCGVKVLRFSVGFGKIVWSRNYGSDATEWAIAAVPLGGYVKMLDGREGTVPADQLYRAFNRQSVGRRAFIVAAGPLANLLLAVLLYWVVFIHGVEELRPRLGSAPLGSPAAAAALPNGAIVKSINGVSIATWQELRWEALQRILDHESIDLELVLDDRAMGTHRIDTASVNSVDLEKDPLRSLGLVLFRPRVDPVVGGVLPNSAAARAGLEVGDRVRRIDGQEINDWTDLAAIARASPGQLLRFEVVRNQQHLFIEITPTAFTEHGQSIGRIGLSARYDPAMDNERFVVLSYGPIESVFKAVRQTSETSVLTLRLLGRMLTGQLSWKNISGPVTIADYAGQSAQLGGTHYLRFLALISISLGVLNLLPIPILDGGHLMYYLIEVIKGGPLSDRIMEYGQRVGVAILGVLMAFAFFNDINRLISG